jgi:signal transduction histidine kinase
MAYCSLANYSKSLVCFDQSLKIYQELNYQLGMGQILQNIGRIYRDLKYLEKARQVFTKALLTVQNSGNRVVQASIQIDLGLTHRELDEYDISLDYFQHSLHIYEELARKGGISINWIHIASVYFAQGRYSESKEILRDQLAATRSCEDRRSEIKILILLGRIFASEGDFRKSRRYLDEAMLSANSIAHTNLIIQANSAYVELNQKSNKYEDALLYATRVSELQDSLRNSELVDKIIGIEIQYELEGKEAEIDLLRTDQEIQAMRLTQQNAIIKLLTFISILILLLFLLLYNRFLLKKRTTEKLAEINQELEELNATKDKFFSIISHDLKNPLSAIVTLSYLLQDEASNLDRDEVIQYAKTIHDESKILTDMLENLLQWSRSQTGTIRCRPESLRIESLVSESLNLISIQATKKEIHVESHIEDASIEVFVDKNMILTVLNNLITNAIKFTPPGGFVTITISENGNYIETHIIDTGVGISSEHIDNIFKPESQYTTIGTAEERGSGLGLIICKEFVSMNQGQIRVNSEPDQGSVFTVSLPKKSIEN